MITETTQLVTDLVSAWNTHDVDRIVAFYAPEFEGDDVAQAAAMHGIDGIRKTITRYFEAFPDLHFTEQEMIVEGQRIVLRWMARGTHNGTLMNIPATARPVTVRGVTFLTVDAGKVTRATLIWDVAGMLRSIGLLPDL